MAGSVRLGGAAFLLLLQKPKNKVEKLKEKVVGTTAILSTGDGDNSSPFTTRGVRQRCHGDPRLCPRAIVPFKLHSHIAVQLKTQRSLALHVSAFLEVTYDIISVGLEIPPICPAKGSMQQPR